MTGFQKFVVFSSCLYVACIVTSLFQKKYMEAWLWGMLILNLNHPTRKAWGKDAE